MQSTSGTNTTTVVNHVVYDTFGQIKSQTNTTWQPLFAYTGREWDADAGLYYYRARWYDARVGRFLSEDPLGFAAGDVNLSRYVANSATMFVDPSGMFGVIPSGGILDEPSGMILDPDSAAIANPNGVFDFESSAMAAAPEVFDAPDISGIDRAQPASAIIPDLSSGPTNGFVPLDQPSRADQVVRVYRPRTIGDRVHAAIDAPWKGTGLIGAFLRSYPLVAAPGPGDYIRALIPKGRGHLVIEYADGHRYISLDGGLTSGEMTEQAMVLAPIVFGRVTPPARTGSSSRPMFADNWEAVLRQRYGAGNVERVPQFRSVGGILENPSVLTGRTPSEVAARLGLTPGWRVETLGRGSHRGQSWALREYGSNGLPTGRMLRWHPGGGHHGSQPYWRIIDHTGDVGGIIPGG
ncbi:MAG: RHS repeat-associated core domain-containing protein [Planctomycetota bacterium]|nr:RHS repeat-associated core domain-containing protein [Planctomycetota bacterium]